MEIRYFKGNAVIEESFSTDDRYVYKLKHNNTCYILKGYKGSLIEVYEEYFFIKAGCHFNGHITKPLFIQYKVESNTIVEIIFESRSLKSNITDKISNVIYPFVSTVSWLNLIGCFRTLTEHCRIK